MKVELTIDDGETKGIAIVGKMSAEDAIKAHGYDPTVVDYEVIS
jgi:hypothetical protein